MNTAITDTLKELKAQGFDLENIKAIEYKETPYESDDIYGTLVEFKLELVNKPVTTTNETPQKDSEKRYKEFLFKLKFFSDPLIYHLRSGLYNDLRIVGAQELVRSNLEGLKRVIEEYSIV